MKLNSFYLWHCMRTFVSFSSCGFMCAFGTIVNILIVNRFKKDLRFLRNVKMLAPSQSKVKHCIREGGWIFFLISEPYEFQICILLLSFLRHLTDIPSLDLIPEYGIWLLLFYRSWWKDSKAATRRGRKKATASRKEKGKGQEFAISWNKPYIIPSFQLLFNCC